MPDVSRAKWFENTVAKHLIDASLDQGRHNGMIRGSSIGSKCDRRLAYMILGYEPIVSTAHSQYVLNFGNAFHDMVQGWMSKMGLVKAKPYITKNGSVGWKGNAEQTLLDEDLGVIGHYDGLTEKMAVADSYCALDKNGQRYLLEFKTISDRSKTVALFLKQYPSGMHIVKKVLKSGESLYSDLTDLSGSKPKSLDHPDCKRLKNIVITEGLKDGDLIDVVVTPGPFSKLTRPKEEHIYQATFYAHKLKADRILIIYLAKDFDESSYKEENILNIPIKAFDLNVDEKILEAIKDKTDKLWKLLEESDGEVLPDRKFSPDDIFSECKFCDFSYTCWEKNHTAESWNARKIKQQALLNLPIAKGEPFTTHPKDEWGRNINKEKITDLHN